MPLYKRKNIDWYRHLAFACVGGFFGAYAIMCRGGVMGSAQTVNLLELVIDALYGRGFNVLEHLGAFLLYAAATMLTVLLPFWWSVNVRRLSPIITAAAAMAECFIPAETEIVIALYPIFFAMAFQWSSFRGARNFYSSTIFSTNNTKQTSLALANYLCDHDRAHLRKLKVFARTLLCFHIGAAAAYLAVTWWYIRGALAVLPLIAWAFFLSVCERRHEALAEEPETIPDSSAHPTSNA